MQIRSCSNIWTMDYLCTCHIIYDLLYKTSLTNCPVQLLHKLNTLVDFEMFKIVWSKMFFSCCMVITHWQYKFLKDDYFMYANCIVMIFMSPVNNLKFPLSVKTCWSKQLYINSIWHVSVRTIAVCLYLFVVFCHWRYSRSTMSKTWPTEFCSPEPHLSTCLLLE